MELGVGWLGRDLTPDLERALATLLGLCAQTQAVGDAVLFVPSDGA